MITIAKILALADAYMAATGVRETTVGLRVMNDSKGIRRLREGRDIGVRNAEKVIKWFSDNWPDDHPWPADIERPDSDGA